MNKKFLFRLGALVLSCVGFISLLWGGVLSNVANVKADDSVSPFYLLVSNGTGSGYFAVNQKTTITAFPAASTITFDRWVGDTSYLADVNSASTTVTMPSKGISVVALYKMISSPNNPATYLTVNNGTGSGSYGQGAYVTIEANPTIATKIFDKWTGDTAYIVDVNSAKTRVTMPNKSITVTATYKDSPVITYVLTVNSGTGSGSYVQGKKVTIEANPTIATKLFDKWTGDTTYVADVNSASTTVTMPAKAITLTATYKTQPAGTYVLAIKNGAGSGFYVKGQKVTIVANAAANGKIFDRWTGATSTNLNSDFIASVTSSTTVVTMPGVATTLTATYKDSTSTRPTSIKDGSMIRLKGGADVYIVKYSGGKWYKRLILSPSVFKSYGHLKWSDIIDVDAATMDSYITSNYVYVAGDSRIWLLEPAGDTGKKTQVTSAADPDSVYEINATDRDSYATTAPSTN